MRWWNRLGSSILAAAAGILCAGHSCAAGAPRPRLVVVLVIDQFSADLFARYRSSFRGGLVRLAAGMAFPNGYQSHAATEACPGHSTILTGRHPAATGIIANRWFDAKAGSSVYCVAVRGTADPQARGPQNLRVDTFGDWLKAARPASRTIAVSGKDRAAIMLAGHRADAVYWWVDGKGFATSPFAGRAGAAVTGPAAAFDNGLFARWRTAPPVLWPAAPPPECRALVAPHRFGGLELSGKVPPEASQGVESGPDFIARADFQDQLRASPIFDPLALDFAAALAKAHRLGHGTATDLLAISLSATDYVGHRYGNGGAEMCVQMKALDQALATFLARMDALNTRYVVVLTADHGAIDAAERAKERGIPARRIDAAAMVRGLNDYLRRTLRLGYEPIRGDDPQQLTINVPRSNAGLRDRVRREAVAWLRARDGVRRVFTAEEVARAVPPAGKSADRLSLAERFHESYDPERSGDIFTAFAEYASIGIPHKRGDAVAGHGSPWDYDRRVPILFWWPGIAAAKRPEPVETVDIAPTLAAMTGVATPRLDGHCLPAVTSCPRQSGKDVRPSARKVP